MISMNFGLITLLIVLLTVILCSLLRSKVRLMSLFQCNSRQKALESHLIEAFESGAAVHLDSVQPDEVSPVNASAVVALETANSLNARYSAADEPPVMTGNSALAYPLTRDFAAEGFHQAGLGNEFEPEKIEFAGFDPLIHQGIALSVLDDVTMPLHLNIGSIGSEISLQDLMYRGEEAVYLASDDLSGQAAGMVVADDVFIGENLFEMPALLGKTAEDSAIVPDLLAMDIIRIGFLVALAAGAAMILLV